LALANPGQRSSYRFVERHDASRDPLDDHGCQTAGFDFANGHRMRRFGDGGQSVQSLPVVEFT
jgi:hypothetical protein